jgi:hypothetical protein
MIYRKVSIKSIDDKHYVASFWIDENGQIDEANLPTGYDILNLVKVLLKKDLTYEYTDEYDYTERDVA